MSIVVRLLTDGKPFLRTDKKPLLRRPFGRNCRIFHGSETVTVYQQCLHVFSVLPYVISDFFRKYARCAFYFNCRVSSVWKRRKSADLRLKTKRRRSKTKRKNRKQKARSCTARKQPIRSKVFAFDLAKVPTASYNGVVGTTGFQSSSLCSNGIYPQMLSMVH